MKIKKSRQIGDLEIESVHLVDRPANKKRWLIRKEECAMATTKNGPTIEPVNSSVTASAGQESQGHQELMTLLKQVTVAIQKSADSEDGATPPADALEQLKALSAKVQSVIDGYDDMDDAAREAATKEIQGMLKAVEVEKADAEDANPEDSTNMAAETEGEEGSAGADEGDSAVGSQTSVKKEEGWWVYTDALRKINSAMWDLVWHIEVALDIDDAAKAGIKAIQESLAGMLTSVTIEKSAVAVPEVTLDVTAETAAADLGAALRTTVAKATELVDVVKSVEAVTDGAQTQLCQIEGIVTGLVNAIENPPQEGTASDNEFVTLMKAVANKALEAEIITNSSTEAPEEVMLEVGQIVGLMKSMTQRYAEADAADFSFADYGTLVDTNRRLTEIRKQYATQTPAPAAETTTAPATTEAQEGDNVVVTKSEWAAVNEQLNALKTRVQKAAEVATGPAATQEPGNTSTTKPFAFPDNYNADHHERVKKLFETAITK